LASSATKNTSEQVRFPHRESQETNVIWQRDGTTRRRDDHDEESDSSTEEIGTLLRQAREERGLDLLAVHDQLGRPITHLEALENGDLARLPDQALALSTLRRYAAFVGLDGDALALQMIDAWPDTPPAPAPDKLPSGKGAPTKKQSGSGGTPITTVVTAVASEPDHLRAFTQTGEVPMARSGAAPVGQGTYGYGVGPGAPTGTFPVVPRQEIKSSKRAVAKARRRLRAPTSLKVFTWVAVVLVLVVAVGFGIQKWRPQWLARTHILRVAAPVNHSGAKSTPGATPTPPPSKVQLGPFTNQSAVLNVNTANFTVAISTSARCWVQVTSSSSSTPLLSEIVPAGQLLTYPAKGTMTVEVGASAVIVAVTIKGQMEFHNSPTTTPFTYTFNPPASGG
jgi:hypothetical protein